MELGLRESLVGVTRYCIHPKEGVRGLTRVGGTKNPDIAAIRALRPDLVFCNGEENRREDLEALATDLRIDVSHPRRVSEVPELLRHFGRLTENPGPAESWATRIESRLGELGTAEPFTFVYLIWREPWMAAGEGTYISDLLSLVGGRNLVTEGDPYPGITVDEIRRSGPDLVLLPDEPYRFRESHRDELAGLLPGAAVELVSGDDFCWHGVRTLRGIDAARELVARPGLRPEGRCYTPGRPPP